MRRLILKMSMSLDGYVGGPNGEIDWLIRSRDEGATAWIADTLWQAGLHVMGSRTYCGLSPDEQSVLRDLSSLRNPSN